MSQQAAKRRRSQAANGYSHLCKQQRPGYKKRSKEASAAHLAAVIARERRIQQASKKGKSK